MDTLYSVHEFAELTGITVKALHHYDRLGLLKPRRTAAGYRIYTKRDLEPLEQIVALKFLGLPLKQIRAVLGRAETTLPEALRQQRLALEEKQRVLALAISAISDAEKEIRPGESDDPAILKRLIMTIDAQKIDLTQYFGEAALAKMRQFWDGASSGEGLEEWKDLQSDLLAAMGEDPAGEAGRVLAIRYRALTQRNTGAFNFISDPGVLNGLKKAGSDLHNWPPGLLRRFQESSAAKVVPFLLKAMAALPTEG